MRYTDVVGYAEFQPSGWPAIGAEVGWLHQPKLSSPAGTFKPDLPVAMDIFPDDPGAALSSQPHFLHSEAYLTVDTRDYPSHPARGGFYRLAWMAFSDRSTDTFSFHQYEAEAAHFLPLADNNWILGFRAWTVLSDVAGDRDVPFYLLPSLGGHNTLRGYSNLRFHDRNTMVVGAESRLAIFQHMDWAVFVDAGNVAPRAGDLDLRKVSYGSGLRIHTGRATLARFDVAHGSDGWSVVVRTSDPFRLSRSRHHVPTVPFFP
jgi:hypothetical protein